MQRLVAVPGQRLPPGRSSRAKPSVSKADQSQTTRDAILFPNRGATNRGNQGRQDSAGHEVEGIQHDHVRAMITRFEKGSLNDQGPDVRVSLYLSMLFF